MIVTAVVSLVRSFTQRLEEVPGTISELEFDQFSENYTVTIVYHYQVDEVEYKGKHIAFDVPGQFSPQDSERLSLYYPKGQFLKVYYHPHNPTQSQLERDLDDALFLAFLLIPTGGAMLYLGLSWGMSLLQAT